MKLSSFFANVHYFRRVSLCKHLFNNKLKPFAFLYSRHNLIQLLFHNIFFSPARRIVLSLIERWKCRLFLQHKFILEECYFLQTKKKREEKKKGRHTFKIGRRHYDTCLCNLNVCFFKKMFPFFPSFGLFFSRFSTKDLDPVFFRDRTRIRHFSGK